MSLKLSTNQIAFALLLWLAWGATSVAAQDKDKAAAQREEFRKRFGDKVDIRFDQPYAGTDNPRQRLDLYLPKKPQSDKPLPVVVFVHGGGWKNGDRFGYSSAAMQQASPGNYAAVSIGYRLSGEAKWPAQIHDCKAAIRWIRAHAKELNLDPDHIGATGASAGGHLVTLLGVTNETKELDGNVGDHLDQSSRVQCVINVCGPTDMLAKLGPGEAPPKYTDSLISELIGGSLEAKADVAKSASPLTFVSAQSVPIMTIHGTADNTVSFKHAEKLDAALTKVGVTSILIPMVNAGHGIPFGPELNGRVQAFWDQYLRGIKSDISNKPIEVTPPPAKKT